MPDIAAGVLVVAPDGDVLLLLRSRTEANYAGHWALPGGKADGDETAEECARRECEEELGELPGNDLMLVDETNTPNGMVYSTFMQNVGEKFYPKLNEEHAGFIWSPLSDLPQPLHPGVERVLVALAERNARFDWHEGQLEIIQPDERRPAPPPEEEIDESETKDPTLELEISE